MTAAVLVAVAVLAIGARLRPHPASRPLDPNIEPPGSRAADAKRGIPSRSIVRRRRSAIDPAELATWCDSLARALRGGDTLHRAVRTIDPPACAARDLAPALLALERGASVGTALAGIRTSSPHLDLVVVVLRACAEHGGTAAEPIDRAAAALRQRAALTAERATQSAQARMSAMVMTILPGAMLLLLLVTSRSVRATAISPVGLVVLTLGAGLNVVGWTWMRRIIGGPV
jgi:tight adherence protein B